MTSKGVTPSSSLLLAHAPIPNPPRGFARATPRGLRRLLPAPAGSGTFPTLSLRVFPWMLGPVSRWLAKVHLPVTSSRNVGLPRLGRGSACQDDPLSDFRAAQAFGTVVIPAVQASKFACHPGRSHRCGSVSTRQPWRIHPSRTYVVTSTRIGYASRPNRAIDDRGLSPH